MVDLQKNYVLRIPIVPDIKKRAPFGSIATQNRVKILNFTFSVMRISYSYVIKI